jgi:cGMP-inhibited 3',5'-cyclic phosphodiesterase A
MSTSTWTTTTSATGMPTLEPEPSRKRSTSFRSLAQSPISATAPPLPRYGFSHFSFKVLFFAKNNNFIAFCFCSPVTIPLKGRSYSTTALPFGTLAALQNCRERQFTYNTNVNEIGSTYRRAEFEEGEADNETTEDEGNETISIPANVILNIQRKQFSPRLNLTSDYDSSNESPSGSDATLDESASLDSGSRFVLSRKSPNISSEMRVESLHKKSISYKDEESYREKKCVLCGTKTKIYAPTDKSPVLQLNWPFSAPPPPIVPQLDKNGHYIIDGTIYDLEELSTLPLLCRIDEWDYPIFELVAQTGDAILSKMSYHVFLEAGLLEAFKIPIPEFLNYFRALEKGYRNKPCM